MSRPGAVAVLHAGEVGGPLRSLERELRWLGERCELEITVPASGKPAPALSGLGATLTRGPYLAPGAPGSVRAAAALAARTAGEVRWFRRLLRARRARLLLAVTTGVPAAFLAARLERVPVILYAAELWSGSGRGRLAEPLARRVPSLAGRLSSRVIACSEAVARQFPATSAVTTIHPPIADAYAGGDGASFRRRHSIPADAPCLASVGSVTVGRAQTLLVRAAAELLPSFPGLRAVIHGDPFARPADLAYSRELDALVASLGLEEAVLRTGAAEPVADVYAAADLVVNPATLPEAFGRVALEAGLAGTPSVCSRVGALPELHLDGLTTLLVAPGDPSALARGIEAVLGDRELGERLAAGAAGLARRIADPDRALSAFQRVVEGQIGS